MAYTKKTWTDRNVQYPGRRKLSAVSGQTDVYDVVRNEGTITTPGDAFSADNMNDLESRVSTGIDDAITTAKDYVDTRIGNAINGEY